MVKIKNKKIIIIADSNGAGKTTFAREFLPNEANCPIFINADLIAAGLSPFAPETIAVKAARIMLAEIKSNLQAGNSLPLKPRWLADITRLKYPNGKSLGIKLN